MKKVMLITGASAGIGRSIARKAALQGYLVCINYRSNHAAAKDLRDELALVGADSTLVQGDVSNEADVLKLFQTVMQKWGRIDVLINNAGIVAPMTDLTQITVDRMRSLLETNVLGTMICAREAVKVMAEQVEGGHIINISSIASRIGSAIEFVDYAATKGAVDSFTLGLSREVANKGIRVNAVRPGLINTEIHRHAGDPMRAEKLKSNIPMGRVGEAEEVANTVLWLAGDQSSYVTGVLLDVAGGR